MLELDIVVIQLAFTLMRRKFLFVGDFIFKETIGRTDLPTGNMKLICKNLLTKLVEFNDDTKIYSGHGEETTLELERKNNPYL